MAGGGVDAGEDGGSRGRGKKKKRNGSGEIANKLLWSKTEKAWPQCNEMNFLMMDRKKKNSRNASEGDISHACELN